MALYSTILQTKFIHLSYSVQKSGNLGRTDCSSSTSNLKSLVNDQGAPRDYGPYLEIHLFVVPCVPLLYLPSLSIRDAYIQRPSKLLTCSSPPCPRGIVSTIAEFSDVSGIHESPSRLHNYPARSHSQKIQLGAPHTVS